jgi:hypothetical protein
MSFSWSLRVFLLSPFLEERNGKSTLSGEKVVMAVASLPTHRQISDHFYREAQHSSSLLPNVSYASTTSSSLDLLSATAGFGAQRTRQSALRCSIERLEQEELSERTFLFQIYAKEQRFYFIIHLKDFHAAVLRYVAACNELGPAALLGPREESKVQSKKLAAWSAALQLIASQEISVPLQCP